MTPKEVVEHRWWERERTRKRRKARRETIFWLCLAVVLAVWAALLISNRVRSADSESVVSQTEDVSPAFASDTVTETPEPTEEVLDVWGMTGKERGIVERVVTQESMGESYLGVQAVAQCIRDTAEATGMTPYDVVMQDGQYAAPALTASNDAKAAVESVLYGDEIAVNANIRYFYSPSLCTSTWHESQLTYVCEIGSHRFFSEKEDG